MKRYRLVILSLFTVIIAYAQKVTVGAPNHVMVGEQFQIEYTVNTQDVDGFQMGKLPDGIEIVFGPSKSSQSSFQMINGHTSSSSSYTYTFVAVIKKKGTFTLPAAKVIAGGKTISSNAVKITASGNSQASSSGNNQYNDEEQDANDRRVSPSSSDALFIRVTANKKKVREQEPVMLTYKVYTLLDLTQLDGKMPELKGFHTQEIKLPQQKTYHRETVNGKSYNCVTWSQYLMYPQMTGNLEIPSIVFHGIIMHESRDPFAFITGGGYQEERRDIKAPGLTIQVEPLPTKPADFSGGVGHFNISGQINKDAIKAGDPLNLRVVVSGSGNMKLMKQPEVKFPEGWDQYDAKVIDKTHLTENGIEGNIVYDILAVPRKEGTFNIPPAKLVYFDTGANSYKTIYTKSFTVDVKKGDGSNSSISDFAVSQDEDIHNIKEGKADFQGVNDFFFGSANYWMLLLLLFSVFIGLLYMFRKTAIEHADMVKMKGKNANKAASRRLKKANEFMQQGKADEFYDEVLRALWGYVGDKLNMPIEQLSRDNISERLSTLNVNETLIGDFINALDECEYERYAPGDARGNMNKTFNTAISVITSIEEAIKNIGKENASSNKVRLLILALLMIPICSFGITKENADTEYKKGNYQQAVKDYLELLQKGNSPEIYYNLGNAYYRLDNITYAIIAYERALLLAPGDRDIRFNLDMARSKTIDKITPESEMFFVTWYKSLINVMSVDGWAYTAIFCLVLVIILVLVYLFCEKTWQRKIGFYCGALFLLFFILSNVLAYQQKRQLTERKWAIIITPSSSVRTTPAKTANEDFVLHEGTKVEIKDKSIKNWYSIQIADGRHGWVVANQLEEI